jgi:hypothetical protein
VRAVFPHTALQSVVSASGLACYTRAAIMVNSSCAAKKALAICLPMTPLPSAANMRSFHAEAFTHDRSRSWVTAPCIVPSDTNSASLSLCLCVKLTHPPSCLPSLDAAFSALFAAYHRYGTMKALTPAQLTCRAGLPTYLATPSCRSVSNHVGCLNIASPTTPACPASFGLRHE